VLEYVMLYWFDNSFYSQQIVKFLFLDIWQLILEY
jgi:hypothetical protein